MRHATISFAKAPGGRSPVDTAACPACSHPMRLHNAGGCVRGECECLEIPAGREEVTVAQPAEPEPAVEPAEEVAPSSTRAAATPGLLDRIGARVAQRRHEAGLSVEKLARAAGIAEGHLGHIEGGRRNITLGVLEAVAGVLGCDVADLVAPEPPAATSCAVGPEVAGGRTPAAALDDLAALVNAVLDRAFFYAARWYCASCISWPLAPGVCPTCRGPLQPVYLATLPREV